MILQLIMTALWICGIRIATGEGMILERVDFFLQVKLPKWLYKPVIGCAYCMSSIHGAFWHLVFGGNLAELPLMVVATIPVVGIIIHIHDKLAE
jgi:ABC-type cobalamin transport system permease subunit